MDNNFNNSSYFINILQWNAQSLRPKISEFQALLSQENIYIALISETWLEPDSSLNISGYNIFRNDRSDSYGGVAIVIHKSIRVQLETLNHSNSGIEIKCVKLLNCKEIKNIILIYCPSSVHTVQSDWDLIFTKYTSKCLIAGDFNAHHHNWSCKSDTRGTMVFDAALDAGYISLNKGAGEHTRIKMVNGYLQKTSPDITFASTDLACKFEWHVLSENLGSDHMCIKIKSIYREAICIGKKRKYKSANWKGYTKTIEEAILPYCRELNAQQNYDYFINIINNAADKYIPYTKQFTHYKPGFQPKSYWNETLSKLVAERRLALSNFRSNPTPFNLNILEEKTTIAKKAISKARLNERRNFYTSIDESTTVSEMWKRMRWLKGCSSAKSYPSRDQKVSLIRDLAPDYVCYEKPTFNSFNVELELPVTLHELCNSLKTKDTAPGEDGVSYSMIFNLPTKGKIFLVNLYNDILNSSTVPVQWRDIVLMPIPKPATTSDSNPKLRPICLISCLCKILHSILTKRIEWFIEKNNILSPYTSGFRRGQSCQDCLTRLTTQIQLGFSKSYATIACFIDVESAYNNVLINKMISILNEIGIGNKICSYLWTFLNERHLKIIDESNEDDTMIRYTSLGLAQGDPISPILFNVVTFKLFSKTNNVHMCQYADDFVLYSTDKNLSESTTKLQETLDIFSSCLAELGLRLSNSKSKLCIFSRGFRRQNITLKINNSALELVDSYKYLGLWLDRSLRWGRHVNEVVRKSQKYLNILKVLAGTSWGIHPKHLRRIYIAIVRSRIDYSCFIYDNSASSHLYKLQKVQNQALRIIGGFIKSTPIHTMESELCIPPLHIRRKFLAYKYCLKSLSWTNNVTIKLLKELNMFINNSYWTRKKIPLLVNVLNEIKDVQVASSSPLEMYTLKTWVSYIDTNNIVSVDLDSMHRAKDCYELNLLKHTVVKELIEKYADWVVIYTDGSKSKKGRGSAFYVRSQENSNGCFKVIGNVCIMSLELIAISEALSYIKTISENRAVICSDSKSALYHIARCASGRRGTPIAYEILSKIEELAEKGVDLRLQWVPSHIGIRGNEEADRLAKIGSTEGQEIYVKPYYSEILTKYNGQCYDLWKEYFDQRSLEKGLWYKTIQCQPPRIPWCTYSQLSRKLITIAHRIRTGHIPSNKFAFLMGKAPSPNCDTCGVIDDTYHLLMECVQFHAERKELFEKFDVDILQVGIMNSLLSKPNSEEACLLFNLLAS